MAGLKDRLRQDVEDTVAAASAEKAGLESELALKDAHISELGKRVQELQVKSGQCAADIYSIVPFFSK